MRPWLTATLAVLRKEATAELRSKVAISGSFLFGVSGLLLILFATATLSGAQAVHFSKLHDGVALKEIDKALYPAWDITAKSGLLWVLLFFAAFTGLAHVFIHEEEVGTTLALRMAAPPSAVYAGKLLFNTSLMGAIGLLLIPIFMATTGMPIGSPLVTIGMFAAGIIGLSATATICAALAAKAKGAGALFSALGLPLVVVFMLLLLNAANTVFTIDASTTRLVRDLGSLISFSILVITASAMLFSFVWEE